MQFNIVQAESSAASEACHLYAPSLVGMDAFQPDLQTDLDACLKQQPADMMNESSDILAANAFSRLSPEQDAMVNRGMLMLFSLCRYFIIEKRK